MNFKILILLLFFFLISCGVKTKPRAPENTLLPSIPDQYYLQNINDSPIQTDDNKADVDDEKDE